MPGPRARRMAQRSARLHRPFEQRLGTRLLRRRHPSGGECASWLHTTMATARLAAHRLAELFARRDVVEPAQRALQIPEHSQESLAPPCHPFVLEQTREKFDAVTQLLAGDPQLVAPPRVEPFYFARPLLDLLASPRQFVDREILDRLLAAPPRRRAAAPPAPAHGPASSHCATSRSNIAKRSEPTACSARSCACTRRLASSARNPSAPEFASRRGIRGISARNTSRSRAGASAWASHLSSALMRATRRSLTTSEKSEIAARSRRRPTRI